MFKDYTECFQTIRILPQIPVEHAILIMKDMHRHLNRRDGRFPFNHRIEHRAFLHDSMLEEEFLLKAALEAVSKSVASAHFQRTFGSL
jgi:hypothetical protein